MQPCQYSLMRRDVCPPWSTGLDLRGWGWARRLAEGWGPRLARQWLQRMSSVYREMRRGRGVDAETAAFTLYCKLHTHAHTLTQALTQKAVATLETPQALQCVCVCLCYSWPAGTSGSEWQPYTHQSQTAAEHGAGWVGESTEMLTDHCLFFCFFITVNRYLLHPSNSAKEAVKSKWLYVQIPPDFSSLRLFCVLATCLNPFLISK